MFKKTGKLIGLLLLLVLSFIYTDKVFSEARKTDPVMVEIKNYKTKHDKKAIEPIIQGDEIILGMSGLIINERKSYQNMKDENKFDDNKIVFNTLKPNKNLTNIYNYYIKKGNSSKKHLSIIIKVYKDSDVDNMIRILENNNLSLTFFVDGAWLEKNVENAFKINNLGCEIYNLGYNGSYDKKMIEVTNNLIESITLKESLFCLNETKNELDKDICARKKMNTILPTVVDPNITELKKHIESGNIISYSIDNFNYNEFNLIISTITSRGYVIDKLTSIINDD